MSSPNNNIEDDEVSLPGFRFHPTDEELVGFYLRRKVEKRPIRIEIIKQIDVYKYDPWDIPKVNDIADKEWFFFCKRGRKYRNSVRPNRVTGSGFWKATGIDRPIYSSTAAGDNININGCIGLKKSLVYYQGSAGKGTKTDWMMHEFRLPTKLPNSKIDAQEAEVWTICRIFKRNSCVRKSAYKQRMARTTTCSTSSDDRSKCISGISTADYDNYKPRSTDDIHERDQLFLAAYMSSPCPNEYELCREESWDELRPIVDFALDPSLQQYHCK